MCKSDQSSRNVFHLKTIHQIRIIRLNSVKLVTIYAGELEQSVSLLTGVTDSKSGTWYLPCIYLRKCYAQQTEKNIDGMKKYQFLLKLLTMIAEKYLEHRIWCVIWKAINARYCHFANTSYCGVKNRTLSNGVAIKEGNQTTRVVRKTT